MQHRENLDLQELIKRYELAKRAEGKSPKTLKGYTEFLLSFYRYIRDNNSDTTISRFTIDIVRELNCICDCKMKLLPCTCEEVRGSKEIKEFVQELVEQGLSKSEVMDSLVERYGQAVLIKKRS